MSVKSQAITVLILGFLAVALHHKKVDMNVYPRFVRNLFLPTVPRSVSALYGNVSDATLVEDCTIIVSAKDFLSQQPEQVAFLATLIPADMHVIYTYPRPLGTDEDVARFLATMKEAQKPLSNVQYLELDPFANPFHGWVSAHQYIRTKYTVNMHNDVFPLDGPRHFLTELHQALETHPESVVAAPQIYEAEVEGGLVSHTINTNLHIRRRSSGALYLSHEVDLNRGTSREPSDFKEGPQPDFLEDHMFMMRTERLPDIVDPKAAYTLEYIDLQLSVRAHNVSVWFVPSVRVEFRVWWACVRWQDIAFFAFRRSERLARSTKLYLQDKWNVEFPNTGFANFVKFSIARAVFLPRKDISDSWYQQAAMVMGWFEWVGFNKYSEQGREDWVLMPEYIDNATSLGRAFVAGRDLVTEPHFYSNASGLESVLEVRERADNMETRMDFDHLSMGVIKVPLASDAMLAGLGTACGLVIRHADGARTCWVYVAPFNYDQSLATWVTEHVAESAKVAMRIAVYLAMNYQMEDLMYRKADLAVLNGVDGMEVSVCGEEDTNCHVQNVVFAPSDELLQWSGHLNSWATVQERLRAVSPAARAALPSPYAWSAYLTVLASLLLLTHASLTLNKCMAGTSLFLLGAAIAGALGAPLAGCSAVTAVVAFAFLSHFRVMPTRCRVYALALTAAYLAAVNTDALSLTPTLEVCILLAAGLALRRLYKLAYTVTTSNGASLLFPVLQHVVPRYSYSRHRFFRADGAPEPVALRREAAFDALSAAWKAKWPKSLAISAELSKRFSDLRFASNNRAFLPFARIIQGAFDPCTVVTATDRMNLTDVDGVRSLDISGSYGVNVHGYDKFKEWMRGGLEDVGKLGCVLGPLHPLVLDNINMLREVSGKDEVSFHMSGTEAVMCATRLARFNTGKRKVVVFSSAYHGWWDGVQTTAGNQREVTDVLTLVDLAESSLSVLRMRSREIAAVLVNPLQSFHPNSPPPSDLVLTSNTRHAGETNNYGKWLARLRKVCSDSGIVLIFDEVYTGFRLHPRGAQGYFGVTGDLVCYGKTLGGGWANGVCCGPSHLMNRSDPAKPLRVAYVIGTFAAHPVLVASMNRFLKHVTAPDAEERYEAKHKQIKDWMIELNAALTAEALPLQVISYTTVWTMLYQIPGRYHWMLQYYLRDEGINLSWVGTGRLNFSHDFEAEDLATVKDRVIRACKRMQQDGWWCTDTASGLSIKLKLVSEFLWAMVFGGN